VYVRRGEFAQAVLIENNRIVAVGSDDDIQAICPHNAQRIDAGQGYVSFCLAA
jgi:predicted amidohydrolase YtcJ